MSTEITTRIEDANWDELFPKLILFAQTRLRYALNTTGDPVIEGFDAKVLLDHAIDKTLDGTRTWKYESVSIENHLMAVIRSDVSAFFKKGIAQRMAKAIETDDGPVSAIDVFMDHSTRPDVTIRNAEVGTRRTEHLEAFKTSIADDSELLKVFDAYDAEFTKPREIAEVTGIEPRRIDQLKRNLLSRYLRFTDEHAGASEKVELIRGQR